MKKNILKELAKNSIKNGEVYEPVAKFALAKLSRNDIKQYLFFLKEEIRKSKVVITSADGLDASLKSQLQQIYQGKFIEFNTNENIVAGLTIQDGDNFLDTSFVGTLKQLGNKLKQSI